MAGAPRGLDGSSGRVRAVGASRRTNVPGSAALAKTSMPRADSSSPRSPIVATTRRSVYVANVRCASRSFAAAALTAESVTTSSAAARETSPVSTMRTMPGVAVRRIPRAARTMKGETFIVRAASPVVTPPVSPPRGPPCCKVAIVLATIAL